MKKKGNALALIIRGVLFCCTVVIFLLFSLSQLHAADSDKTPPFEETELMFLGEELHMVSIASRRREPLQRAPAAVTIISGEELKKYRTLAEVLRRVPGFFVDRNELKERIYLRGVPDSFLVMMDGVPFASDASTSDYPRGMELSLDYIEKIEIIRGPGSALWGPDAFSGIVNLVTKKGADIHGLYLKAETGSYDTRGVNATGGFNKKGWDAVFSVAGSETEGFEGDLGGSEKRNKDHYFELYGKVSYKDIVEISGRHSRYRDFYTEPQFYLEPSERKPFSFVQATVNKTVEDASFSLQAWFQYFDNLDDYDNSRLEQENRQYGIEVKYDRTLFGNHFATIGTSFRYNNGGKTTFKFKDIKLGVFPDFDNKLYSVYLQDKWRVLENLEFTFGIRYDDHSEYERFFSPRAGVSFLFWDYFSLKLLYGRAFRTPNLAVLIERSGLDPERIDSFEAELGFHFKNIFTLEVNYFYNKLEKIIERDAAGTITNSGRENIKGIEVSITGRPYHHLSLYANYSHLFGERQKGSRVTKLVPSPEDPNQTVESTLESFINVAPENIFNLGVDYVFYNKIRTNFEFNYVSKRKLAKGGATIFSGRNSLTSYWLIDFNLFVKDFPFRNFETALKIKNITDEKYSTRGVFGLVDGEGSSMYFMIRYKF